MNIEELKTMSLSELQNSRVIVVPKCKRCIGYDYTLMAGCKINNSVLKENDCDGFPTECQLLNLHEVVELYDEKKQKCNCAICRGEING